MSPERRFKIATLSVIAMKGTIKEWAILQIIFATQRWCRHWIKLQDMTLYWRIYSEWVSEDYRSNSNVSTSKKYLGESLHFFTTNHYINNPTMHHTFMCVTESSSVLETSFSILYKYFTSQRLHIRVSFLTSFPFTYKKKSHSQGLWIRHYLNAKD